MKPMQSSSKLWLLVLYFYVAPLVGGVLLVLQNGHLLGDFPHVSVEFDPTGLLFYAVAYLAPLVVIVIAVRQGSRLNTWFAHKGYAEFIFYILLWVALFTLVFGAIPVGAPPAPGITGVVQTVILKFNPYLLFLFLAALRVPPWQMVIGGLCVLVMGLSQKSLLGYFIVAMAFLVYWVDNKVSGRWHIILLFAIPIVLIVGLQEGISYLYSLRNESRGIATDIPENLILSYALGRINSFSSMYQIINDDCCGAAPSTFYVIGNFLERLTGLGVFASATPGQTYNEFLLGAGSEYAIFTSTAGAVYILFKSGWSILVVNVVALLVILKIMYVMVPLPTGPRKLPLFLIVLYLPYLSGDVWELSLSFQSIMLLRMTYWLVRFIRYGVRPRMSV